MSRNQSTHGFDRLAYMGVGFTPAAVYVQPRDPLATDQNGIPLGTLWINETTTSVFMLVQKLYNVPLKKILGTWVGISGNFFNEVHADAGVATPAAGVLNVSGGLNINTFAAGNTVTINLDDLISLPNTDAVETAGELRLGGNRWISNYGTRNTFVGQSSGKTTLTIANAISNIGLGPSALAALTTGDRNIAIGYASGFNITTGATNVSIGVGNSQLLTTGSQNTALGDSALAELLTGANNVCIGFGAGHTAVPGTGYTGAESSNIILGENSGVTGESHVMRLGLDGTGAGQQDTCYIAGTTHITRNLNLKTSDGSGAFGYIYTSDGGGPTRFISNPGQDNVFVGEASGSFFPVLGTPISNAGFGANCFQAIHDAQGCVAVGFASGQIVNDAIDSTMVGHNSGNALTDGGLNTLIGAYAGLRLTTGGGNTALGNNALDHVVTGGANLGLGGGAGQAYTLADSSNIVLLNNGVAGQSNTIRIGTTGNGNGQQNKCWIAAIRGVTTDVADAIPVLIDSTGQLGTVSSSERYKENIEDIGPLSDPLLDLRPVTFTYKSDKSQTTQYGLIAEEVDALLPELVIYDKEGLPDTVKYHELPVLLLNELQKCVATIENLEERIAKLEKKKNK